MGTNRPGAGLRRLTPVGVVMALLAALLTLGAQLPAHAAGTHVVTAQLRLSTGSPTEGYVEVLRKDPDPATTYSSYDDDYAPEGHVDVDLPPGTYKLRFVSFDLGEEKWYATGDDTGVDEDSATPVDIAGDRDLGQITFAVRTITAIVRDQYGNPVTGVSVRLAPDPDDLEWDWWDARTTDSQGRAVFHNQSATEPAYLTAVDDNDEPGYYPSGDVQQAPAGSVNATVNLAMAKKATVSGWVSRAGGVGVGLIQVRVLDEAGNQFGSTATTRSDGTYTVTGVPPGYYTAEFSDPLGDYETQYYHGKSSLAEAEINGVPAGMQVTGLNAVMTPAGNPAPTGVDLAGVVSGRGKPLGNVLVTAWRNGADKESVVTGRDGKYAFTSLTGGTYKVSYDRLSGPADELPYVGQWYLGSHSSGTATPITVTEDSPGASRNVTLDSYGVITGSVVDAAGNPVAYPEVGARDLDGSCVWSSETPPSYPDPYDFCFPSAETGNGTYRLVVAPGSYHLRFDGWDDAFGTPFIREWWDNAPTMSGATPITVAPGATVTANARLTKNLETLAAPTITGSARVGSTLTASTGTWNVMASNEFEYAWFRGATQVGSGPTYTPTAADAGSKVSVRVTAWHGSLTGTSFSAATAVVKHTSASTLTGKSPKAHVVRLTVTVTVPGVSGPGGTVTIKRGSKVVKSGVAVVNGQAVVKLTNQRSGKRTYTAVYSGTSTVEPSTSNSRTVKVK